jgi:hypothetical protein
MDLAISNLAAFVLTTVHFSHPGRYTGYRGQDKELLNYTSTVSSFYSDTGLTAFAKSLYPVRMETLVHPTSESAIAERPDSLVFNGLVKMQKRADPINELGKMLMAHLHQVGVYGLASVISGIDENRVLRLAVLGMYS